MMDGGVVHLFLHRHPGKTTGGHDEPPPSEDGKENMLVSGNNVHAAQQNRTIMGFLLRWVVTALSVGVAVWIVPGLTPVGSNATVAIFALGLILALINMSLKPLLQLISFPITVLTLGIFYLIVNALLLMLAAWAAGGIFGSGIAIDGFGSAFLGSIIISIVSAIANALVGNKDKS